MCGIFLARALVSLYLFIYRSCRCALRFPHTLVSAPSIVGGFYPVLLYPDFIVTARGERDGGLRLLPDEAAGGMAGSLHAWMTPQLKEGLY